MVNGSWMVFALGFKLFSPTYALAASATNVVSIAPAPIYSLNPQYSTALHEGLYNGSFSVTDTLSSDFGWQYRGGRFRQGADISCLPERLIRRNGTAPYWIA